MQISVGTARPNTQILQKLGDKYPFTHRLDVVLTTSEEQARSLSSFETSYYRRKITFSELFLAVSASSSGRTALTLGFPTLDSWCLDARGILSLSLTSETYERLGIGVGAQIGLERVDERILIKLDLHGRTSPAVVRARICLERWDLQRAGEGKHGWDALLSFPSEGVSSEPIIDSHIATALPEVKLSVRALLQTTVNAHTPSRSLPTIKSDNAQDEFADLFEWAGLASLGSQRLLVDDSVRSYAAFYEPPSGSSVGDIYHLTWCGFISPAFVHSVLQEVLMSANGVRAISALSFDAPVSYIFPSGATRAGEKVWTMIVSETEVLGDKNWVLAENCK